jgi:hypothetical protein
MPSLGWWSVKTDSRNTPWMKSWMHEDVAMDGSSWYDGWGMDLKKINGWQQVP